METLKYKVIKSKKQYDKYCTTLEELLSIDTDNQDHNALDEVELLTCLIEKWDEENNSFLEIDPITLLTGLMGERSVKSKDLADILGVSKGLISDILNYKKGLSKDVIRNLASYFKLSQEAFNRPYKLKVEVNLRLKNASVMNTVKNSSYSSQSSRVR
jgi:HTH-type transcriptional regulator/antitoxin HigA